MRLALERRGNSEGDSEIDDIAAIQRAVAHR